MSSRKHQSIIFTYLSETANQQGLLIKTNLLSSQLLFPMSEFLPKKIPFMVKTPVYMVLCDVNCRAVYTLEKPYNCVTSFLCIVLYESKATIVGN